MRKCILVLLMAVSAVCTLGAQEQKLDLDKAVSTAAKSITTYFKGKEFKKKNVTVAVVVSMTSTEDMANYLSNKFEAEIGKVKSCTLVARDSLTRSMRQAEINYQYSGFVSDTEMVTIGTESGAQYIVSVSFEQIEDENRLTVKTVNVETALIVVGTDTFIINPSKKVSSLLENKRQLTTLADFLAEIETWKRKKISEENARDKELILEQGNITTEYVKKIEEAKQKKYPVNYSDEFIAESRANEIHSLEYERDKALAGARETINAKYTPGIQTCEAKKEDAIRSLLEKRFVLEGKDKVFVTVGDFSRNSKPQYFPLTIRSQDANVIYSNDFRIEVKDNDVLDFNRINDPKENNQLSGRITFSVSRIRGTDEFIVNIIKVELLNSGSGSVLYSVSPNTTANTVPLRGQNNGEVSSSASSTSTSVSVQDVRTTSSSGVVSERTEYTMEQARLFYEAHLRDSAPEQHTVGTQYGILPNIAYTQEVIVDDWMDKGDWNQRCGRMVFCAYEVTQELYELVMNENPSAFSGDDYFNYNYAGDGGYSYNGGFFHTPPTHLPANNMTWYEAIAFCNELTKRSSSFSKANCVYYRDEQYKELYTIQDAKNRRRVYADLKASGYRLPTLDEWEAAAGGVLTEGWLGETYRKFNHTYSGSDTISDVAYYKTNAGFLNDAFEIVNVPQEVGTKMPNENGLYDMTGNVWEWIWSEYGAYAYNENAVPIKGGCYYNDERHCALNWYALQLPNRADKGIGFRVCRTYIEE